MRNQILLFSLLLTITSCTEYLLYYQTYTVESELEQNEGSLKYLACRTAEIRTIWEKSW